MKAQYVYFIPFRLDFVAYNGSEDPCIKNNPSEEPTRSEVITLSELPEVHMVLHDTPNPYDNNPDLRVIGLSEYIGAGGSEINEIAVIPN